jgi:hypothetical protein
MAKRGRAPARRSKTRKSSSTKVRKSNAERTKKAAEARRCKFSPELEARARYLFEETDASLADIAFELGIHKCTVPAVARRRNWKRYAPPPRDVSPVTRILVEAETLERRQNAAQSGPETEAEKHAGPEGASEKSESDDLVARLRRAVLNELTVVESLRDRLKNEPQSRVAAERTARTLSTLTDTLQKLQRLQCAVPANGPDYDMPADIDAFRDELARQIEEFVASRSDTPNGERATAPEENDQAGH